MILNYLKIAVRNLSRFKIYSFINISGLAIGIACTILILLWVKDELSYDKFHENIDNVYHVYLRIFDESKNINEQSSTSFQIASAIEEKLPEVIMTTRMGFLGEVVLRHEDKIFSETQGMAADETLFDILSFPIIKGSVSEILKEPGNIVLTESFARKYFEEKDPLNQELVINGKYNFIVRAIIADIPDNSHQKFDFLVPFNFLEDLGNNLEFDGNLFSYCRYHTYLLCEDDLDMEELNNSVRSNFNFSSDNISGETFLVPLSQTYRYNLFGGDIIIYVLISIAGLILIIACFNYSNLSIALSSIRYKEVGIRKVFGANKKQLIMQFLGETIVYVLIAINFSLLLINFLLPHFNVLTGKKLGIELIDISFMLVILLILIITTLLAGSYPALYLSKFNPGKILQGRGVNAKGKSPIRKTLVISQFTIAILFFLSTVIIDQQFYYMDHSDLGFNKNNILYISLNKNIRSKAIEIKNELQRISKIGHISTTSHLPILIVGGYYQEWGRAGRENSYLVSTGVDYEYLKTLNIEMSEGRFYDPAYVGDQHNIVVNETAINELGLESPIGENFLYQGNNYEIIGVMKDFHHVPLVMNISPVAFFLTPNEADYLLLEINAFNESEQSALLSQIKIKWKEINPDYPLIYNFLEDYTFPQEKTATVAQKLVRYFTFIAVILSCFGLFGLSTFSILQKTKEIGIRKVMGATKISIVKQLFVEYLKMLFIANLIALPIGYFLMNKFLDAFAYKINISAWIFVMVSISILIMALFTVGYQALKSAGRNPVETLKYE